MLLGGTRTYVFSLVVPYLVDAVDVKNSKFVKSTDLRLCPQLDNLPPPETARDVRPDQIEVVMALGDSLSAALVARTPGEQQSRFVSDTQRPFKWDPIGISNWIEYRGISYPSGLDPDAISLASLFSHYANITGGSTGQHSVLTCASKLCGRAEEDGLNAAISGSRAGSLKSQVSDWLVPRLNELGVRDEAWKFVNIGVGGNDLCGSCLNPDVELPAGYSPAQYARNVKEAVEHLRMHVPRLIVNIVGMFRITPLYDLKLRSHKCSSLPLSLPIPGVPNFPLECSCALLPPPGGNLTRARMDSLAAAYDTAILDLIQAWEEENDPYLGVIWQPGEAIDLRRWDERSLSGVDCFHPSVDAHRRVGAGFWNRLTLDLREKAEPIEWEEDIMIRCLKDSDRFPVGKVAEQRKTIGK